MASLQTRKDIASKVLKVGLNRVWFDPSRLDDIKSAITRNDIKDLIKEEAIKKRAVKGVKRRAGKKHILRKKKGRKKGPGKIKKYIVKRKTEYIILIRKLRSYLRALKNRGMINSKEYQKLRRYARAGEFIKKQDINDYIKTKLRIKK